MSPSLAVFQNHAVLEFMTQWVSNLTRKWSNLSEFLLFPSPPNALGKGKNYKGVEEESGCGRFALQRQRGLFIPRAFSYSALHNHLTVL